MVAFDIAPSLVKIFYHSDRGNHVMTRPTRQWVGEPWDAGGGEYARWSDDTLISAPTMIEAFITLLLPIYTEQVVFDSYIIYNVEEPSPGEFVNVPVYAELLTGQQGDITDVVQYLAWMKTYSFLSTDSHNAKIVLLDVPTGGQINKTGTVSGAELAIVNAFMSTSNAWAARDDNRPVAFRSLNNSVNKALERKYGF
jgi:hypothetical protein